MSRETKNDIEEAGHWHPIDFRLFLLVCDGLERGAGPARLPLPGTAGADTKKPL